MMIKPNCMQAFRCVAAFVCLGIVCSNGLLGQEPASQPTQTDPPPQRKLGYRVTDWKTIHTRDQADAKQNLKTLTELGCEVDSQDHGDHADIRYRLSDWKAMQLSSDQLVEQWSKWLEEKDFEVIIINPAATSKRLTVQFRLMEPKTVHLHNPASASKIINTLHLIDVDVSTNSHGNHIDATFHCPQWNSIALSTDEIAHAWKSWLDESGFETIHEHPDNPK